jgi:chromosome segregation ATPase
MDFVGKLEGASWGDALSMSPTAVDELDRATLQALLDQKDEEVMGLAAHLETLEKDVGLGQDRIHELEAQVQALQAKLEAAVQDSEDTDMSQLLQDNWTLRADGDAMKAQLDKLKKALETSKVSLGPLADAPKGLH